MDGHPPTAQRALLQFGLGVSAICLEAFAETPAVAEVEPRPLPPRGPTWRGTRLRVDP